MNSELLRVAVAAPLLEPLTYLATQDLQNPWTRGQSVKVPLGKRIVNGVIVGSTQEKGNFSLKTVQDIDLQRPVIPEAYMNWLEWIANYYLYPLGEVIESVFPPLPKEGKGRKEFSSPVVATQDKDSPQVLNQEQQRCFENMRQQSGFRVHLLHGVTGSGKTEVYLHLLKEVVAAGRSGLVLVPEISLTPQLIERFAKRFGDEVAVLHSQLTARERTNQWWAASEARKKILIGARSALFCPLKELGLIIIDEEHESSFKQDEKFKYHARDAAIALAKFLDIPIVLGSATPSLESWKNALDGKYTLHTMEQRVAKRTLPQVQVVDLRDKTKAESDLPFWLGQELYEKLSENFSAGKQSALFLNRRGVAQNTFCDSCGFAYECPNCSITLTLHGKSHLVCHYCDYSTRLEEHCPQCKEGVVKPVGLGTELVENDLRELFPEARVFRADRDEINNRESLQEFIDKMANHEIDILIGTQMIAKGLDFTNLTLVGLILADVGFHLPDFRASERSFQLMTQMSGRAGRHSAQPGQVIIQTFNQEHPSIHFAQTADYRGFAENELKLRQQLNYPPFGRLCLLRIQAAHFASAEQCAQAVQHRAQQLKSKHAELSQVEILGPCPAPIAKLRNQYRFQLLLKAPSATVLHAIARSILGDHKWQPTGTKVQVDIDPVNMM